MVLRNPGLVGLLLVLWSSTVAASEPLIGTPLRSDACQIAVVLKADGSADFHGPAHAGSAQWDVDGDRFKMEIDGEPDEFEGRIVAADRIEGIYRRTDVSGLVNEDPCVLTPKA